jgi:hypothetical protein
VGLPWRRDGHLGIGSGGDGLGDLDHGGKWRVATVTELLRKVVWGSPGTEDEQQFGGVEFRLGKRDLGQVHGDLELANLPFPVCLPEQLVREGKALPHPIFPNTGWEGFPIPDERALPDALALFRLEFEWVVAHDPTGAASQSGEA